MSNKKWPSYNEVLDKFQRVLVGEMTREQVSQWATAYIVNDDIYDIRDPRLWRLLDLASGMDIKVNTQDYLHNEEDIMDWLKL